jgi:maltooligosyltrehalose trehalohydrolase
VTRETGGAPEWLAPAPLTTYLTPVLSSEPERKAGPVRAPTTRRLPVGAEVQPGGGVHFRVWSPGRRRVEAVLEDGGEVALTAERDGYWSGYLAAARAGQRYRYRVDGEGPFPDPASRFQPEGPHGPSEIVDPSAFAWTDGSWQGLQLAGQVMYELHLGTFSPEASWDGARARLRHLRDLGVTAIEVMPVASFPGRFGWGYDGVALYAPHAGYGRPDDLRRFVDEAHQLGMGVLLDVVYNHAGPDGSYLRTFSPHYFSERSTEWGQAFNYDGPQSAPVRELFAENAAYWISEFHLDGLRLDATQGIFDDSTDHMVAELTRRARAASGGRSIVLVAENEPQEARLVRPQAAGGLGLDGIWNDDFHHSAVVALTGQNEAYYSDYLGSAHELVAAAQHGFIYQGQWSQWQKKRRGSPAWDLRPHTFVAYLENHDQIANSGVGQRLWQRTAPGRWRAMTGLFLLGPWTPLLFQGQEWNSSAPFLFFADHNPELRPKVRQGRIEFVSQFPNLGSAEMRDRLLDPGAPETAAACRLDWSEPGQPAHQQALALHRDLLALRRSDPVIAAQGENVRIDGAVLGPDCLVLRYTAQGDDRLLLVNLGRELRLHLMPEPLLAAPDGRSWRLLWSSESPRYGGAGTAPLERPGEGWRVPGQTTVLLGGAAAT